MVRPTAARRCADCARKKKKCLHVDEEQDDQLVCKIGSEKKRKIQKPSQFVPTEERPPSTVCPRTAKRRQIEKLYTLDEVKVMLEEGVKDMVGKLQVKLQAKQKMLRKAHNKLATQAKFMAARAELSTKQSGIKNYFSSLATIPEDPAVDEDGEVQGAGIEGYEALSDKTLKSHTGEMLASTDDDLVGAFITGNALIACE